MSSGLRLVTSLPSTTTSSSTHFAPAFCRSVFKDGQEAIRFPFAAPASITVHGAWQIAATGLSESKKALANATAFGSVRSLSGFITPPGSSNASNSSGFALSSCLSTGNSSPHSVCFQPRTCARCGETMLTSAPASTSAFRGSVISTCSNPFSMRMATLTPLTFPMAVSWLSEWIFYAARAAAHRTSPRQPKAA